MRMNHDSVRKAPNPVPREWLIMYHKYVMCFLSSLFAQHGPFIQNSLPPGEIPASSVALCWAEMWLNISAQQ